ncbi:MAG: SMC family ATPase [Armatimonadetes bacterium]|nr:SMC family ATPase [Armatimonadota bacterium]
MRLISLELYNFRQHDETRIEFLPGVTGIIGKNGSGKTTILEAIGWALYGAVAVRGTNEHIRWRGAEGNAAVEAKLAFGLGAHTYMVARRMESSGRSVANLSVDGVPARTGFKEVTEAVTNLLGMDYQAFFTSFFTGQKELEFMRGMDGRQRAGAISRMLGYERLVRAREKANQDRIGLHREIEGLERGLADPEEISKEKAEAQVAVKAAEKSVAEAAARLEAAAKTLDKIKPLRDLSEQKARRNEELSRRLELDRAEESRAASRAKEIGADLEGLAAAEKELDAITPQVEEYRTAGEEYRRLADLQKHEARRREILGQLRSAVESETSLEKRIAELAATPEVLAGAEKSLADLERQIEEVEAGLRKERESLSSARHRAQAELEQVSAQREEIVEKKRTIEDAGQDGKCPTCERPLAEELPRVLAGFDAQLSRLDSRIGKLRQRIAELEKEPEAVSALAKLLDTLTRTREEKRRERETAAMRNEQLAAYERDLAERREAVKSLKAELETIPSDFDQERFSELHEIGKKLRPVNERAIHLRASLDRRASLQNDLKREQDALARVREQIAEAGKAIQKLEFSKEEHERLMKDYEAAAAAHGATLIEVERAKGDLKGAQAALAAALADEKNYQLKEVELKEKRRLRLHLQTLAEAFDRLRLDLNSRAAPELAEAAGDLLSELTDGRYSTLDVNENYEATILDDGELKPIISGGEEDIVNLSLRLAVSQMIADRAGQDLSLLILDEIFGSLDDIRRDNVVALLQTLKNRFEQIVVITHVESVHDAVDNCIWVDFDEATKSSRVKIHPNYASAVASDCTPVMGPDLKSGPITGAS